jgi:hypothetical protein
MGSMLDEQQRRPRPAWGLRGARLAPAWRLPGDAGNRAPARLFNQPQCSAENASRDNAVSD